MENVLFAPEIAFQNVERKPKWLLPLLLITVLSIVSWFAIVQRIGLDTISRTQLENSPQWEQMTPEAREHAIEMSTSTVMQVIGYVPVVVGPALLLLAVSGAFLLAFALTGAEATFRKLFAVSAHAIFGYTLVSTGLTIAVLLLARNPQALDVNNLVHTNLAFLAKGGERPVLAAFLGSLDLLSFYAIYLLSLGNSIVNRRSLGFNLAVTTFLWAVYVAGKLAITSFWS